MIVASIGLSWIASELQPYRKQREVANAIILLGGSVQWDTNWPRNESRKHPWLRKVLGDEFFAYPHVVCVCDDVAMEYIMELPQPAVLALTGSQADEMGQASLTSKRPDPLDSPPLDSPRPFSHAQQPKSGSGILWVVPSLA